MANPTWFIEQDYLASKLDKLKAADPVQYGSWTTAQVKEAIEGAGMTAFDHFQAYNKAEGTSPNQYFNAYEYIGSKVVALNAASFNGRTDWTHEEVKTALDSVGGAWAHYEQFGAAEGTNPSNAFSASGYYASKAAALGGDWTAASVEEYFKANGVNPLDHYLTVGKDEAGVEVSAVPADQRVPADPTSNVGETFTLTTGADVFPGELDNSKNDIINGETSVFSAQNTLNPNDRLDGGLGEDVANFKMGADFAGFGSNAFLRNVETVNLTNEGPIARVFNGVRVEDVKAYNLTGNVNLAQLASATSAVNIGARTADVAIGINAAATTGANDSLAIGLNDVAGATAAAARGIAVTATGLENVSFTATGSNNIALTGATGLTSVKAAGTGSLGLNLTGTSAAANAIASVDASALTGALNLTVDSGDLATTAAVKGGSASTDTLTLSGGFATVTVPAYAMTGIETLAFANTAASPAVAEAASFNALNTTGLSTVALAANAMGAKDVTNLGSANMAVELRGNTAVSTLTLDHTGSTVLNVLGATAGTAAAATAVVAGLSVANSSGIEMTVAETAKYNGTVTVGGNAKSAVINVNNTGAANSNAVAFDGTVSALEQIIVNSKGDLSVTGATAARVITAETAGALTVGAAVAASSVSVSGAGRAEFGAIGGNATQQGNVSVTATGLTSTVALTPAFQTGAIASKDGTSASVAVSGVKGGVTLAGVTGAAGATVAVEAAGAIALGGVSSTAANATTTVTVNGSNGSVTTGAIASGAGAGATSVTAKLTSTNATHDLTVGAIAGGTGDVTVNLSGTSLVTATGGGEITVGAITASKTASLDLTNVTAEQVTIGTITASDAVTINASTLTLNAANGLTINAGTTKALTLTGANSFANTVTSSVTDSATVIGGSKVDTIDLTAGALATKTTTISVDVGADTSADSVTLVAEQAGKLVASIANFSAVNDRLTITDANFGTNVITLDATQEIAAKALIVNFLASAGKTATANAIDNVFRLDVSNDGATGNADFVFQFDGATHIINNDQLFDAAAPVAGSNVFGDGEALISLTGVTGLNSVALVEAVFA